MKAEDIKVGMWVRTRSGAVMRVDYVLERTHAVGTMDDGSPWSADISACGPWVPRVGEWVRRKVDGTAFQVAFIPTFNEWLSVVEPCLPPAPQTTHMHADGTETPAMVPHWTASAPLTVTKRGPDVVSLGANGKCLKCGGPAYLGLQEARCLAPKCERVEPEPTRVVEMWRDADGEISPVRFYASASERVWEAVGRGRNAQHPIREEAIRLWREAVRRG